MKVIAIAAVATAALVQSAAAWSQAPVHPVTVCLDPQGQRHQAYCTRGTEGGAAYTCHCAAGTQSVSAMPCVVGQSQPQGAAADAARAKAATTGTLVGVAVDGRPMCMQMRHAATR